MGEAAFDWLKKGLRQRICFGVPGTVDQDASRSRSGTDVDEGADSEGSDSDARSTIDTDEDEEFEVGVRNASNNTTQPGTDEEASSPRRAHGLDSRSVSREPTPQPVKQAPA